MQGRDRIDYILKPEVTDYPEKYCSHLTNKFAMANLQTIDLNAAMHQMSKFAPIALVVCAILSFACVGIFSVDYYEELFSVRFKTNARELAILVSVIQELVRFGLLVSSMSDFSEGKNLNGWLGLIGSLFLVWHDVNIASKLALMWDASNPEAYTGVLQFLIFIGLLLEIRLVMMLSGRKENTAKKTSRNAKKNGVAIEQNEYA